MHRGIQNGVDGLVMMEGSEAMRMEPELVCLKALLSPLSGIVDTHSLMLSLVVFLFSSFSFPILVTLGSTQVHASDKISVSLIEYWILYDLVYITLNPHMGAGRS